jgi:hypothetical protein
MRYLWIVAAALSGLLFWARPISAGETAAVVPAAAPPADERFFAVFLAHQSPENAIKFSHTFAVFLRTSNDGTKRRINEACTISWFPVSEIVSVARSAEPGVNKTLEQTLTWAEQRGLAITLVGPYEIDARLFARAVAQAARLNRGELRYKAFDRLSRNTAINCVHAVADILEEDGPLNSGTARGHEATQLVVRHFERHFVSSSVAPEADALVDALHLRRFRQPTSSDVATGGGQ